MENIRKQLAEVEKVSLCHDDHGGITLYIGLNYGGVHQALWGVTLGSMTVGKKGKGWGENGAGIDFISRVFDVFGVESLDEIKGKHIFAYSTQSEVLGLESLPFKTGNTKTFMIVDWVACWFEKEVLIKVPK
jgi:hypothetical protein